MSQKYLTTIAAGTSSPRNAKLGTVRAVMAEYIAALRRSGNNSARVTLHGIHIYVNGEPYPISTIKRMTEELKTRRGESNGTR
jgi:hypothetical protein